MAKLNSGLAHPQSRASGRFSGALMPATVGSESESEPETTLTNKNLNEIQELGEIPAKKPDGPFGL